MTSSRRTRLFAVGAAGFAALFAWGLWGLPGFSHYRGPYGKVLDSVAVKERHATNVVAAVTFDYRGVDTMGEEFILFAAAMGVALLLRHQREESEAPPEDVAAGRVPPPSSEAVRLLGLGMVGPVALLGIYLVAHGHLTPGGGFQGGVVLATALILVYLAGEYLEFKSVGPIELIDIAEGIGAGGYVIIGLAALASGSAFLSDFLPLGSVGQLDSAGSIPLINVSVGLEVAAAFALLLSEFLEQTIVLRRRSR
jgi:multicomponent Na+:H+ antiporter subunit B